MYNGRKVMAEVCTKHNWHTFRVADLDGGIEVELYVSNVGDKRVVIAWTPENTAPLVSVAGKSVKGACALIEARRFIEGTK